MYYILCNRIIANGWFLLFTVNLITITVYLRFVWHLTLHHWNITNFRHNCNNVINKCLSNILCSKSIFYFSLYLLFFTYKWWPLGTDIIMRIQLLECGLIRLLYSSLDILYIFIRWTPCWTVTKHFEDSSITSFYLFLR